MTLSLLTDEEIDLLQHALDTIRQQRVNIPPRPPMERSFSEAEDHQAPEVYIAKPQTSDGIPKLLESGLGTGTDVSGSNFDEPGKAECDIYQILIDGTSGDPELHVIGLNLVVHNLSTSDLAQDWIVVVRTKFGKWVAVVPSGGTTITVVTDVRVNGLTIQIKTRDIDVLSAEIESEWTTIHTGIDCSDTGTGS